MQIKTIFFSLCFLPILSFSQSKWDNEKIIVQNESATSTLLHADKLYEHRWDTLPQTQFWKKIMQLSPDSCIINVASNRKIIDKVALKKWSAQTEFQKDLYRDSVRLVHGLSTTEQINVTTGKNDFYRFKDVYPSLSKGIKEFERNGVDPWYAQAILLIESPGQLKKSSVGAYGAFQLMPSVARSYGLVVNTDFDERKSFERSAYAASKLIERVCIPSAKSILSDHNITYNESDLWFRLFVLHVYHAGASNVRAVVSKIAPQIGNRELIMEMWQTKAASFGNNSQNYTQLALASQFILDELVYTTCTEINRLK